jgi:DnaJ-class molecular chaperone
MILLSFLILLAIAVKGGDGKDLYAVLGLKKNADKTEIKKAYRQKAKDTHPDRNPGVDTETAANQFREIASAYEVLSDESSRRTYDRTGKTASEIKEEQMRQQSQRGSQQRSHNFGNFWQFNQNSQRAGVKYHRFFMDHYTRRSILNAQSRVLTVTGLSHLQGIALDDETGLTERYVSQ